MFGLGIPEIAIILVVAILIFGPKKLPELGNALGKSLRGFKEEINNKPENEEDIEKDY
ncbi:twin-arginine translocase TatA/TatE family subunit [Cyanobacterium stanieri LEGE 03274]|uniref:Sec-independent protein translocase protein TatA n=1 Tax=Cyanobacterium stanieri LEGE 03274 TaxID=1828756 RepID=A0ABR9V101_9CHRO|nr:twin-arginine translocase TatA/TatE family subunit [Cyanobacterium stanieri]MBE9221251.1 twin-arginine translocase TatA/TatE family subunit [Cyanobacterium stanieri LEGE 03274]